MNRIPLFLVLSALLVSCGDSNLDSQTSILKSESDTLYTEGKAMNIFRSDPERALVIIDSAVIVGNITPLRGEYLKAVTQYSGLDDFPLARQTCLKLIDDLQFDSADAQQIENRKSSNSKSGIDSLTVMQTYSLLVNIEMQLGNSPDAIRYATEGSRLAHALNKPAEMSKFEGTVAQIMMEETEHKDEGLNRLRSVVGELRQIDTFQGIVSYHNTAANLLRALHDNCLYEEMVPVCESMLQRIDELEQHPDHFRNDKEGFSPADFIDFARGRTSAYLTIAYACLYSAKGVKGPDGVVRYYKSHEKIEMPADDPSTIMKKALAAEEAVFRTKWSRSIDCDKLLTSAYHLLGQYDRFDEAMARLEVWWKESGDDTISFSNRNRLAICGEAAHLRGRYADALDYWMRSYTIKDSLDARNQREQLAELSTQYHLQEEQFARQKAEDDARFLRWITAAAIVIVVLAVCFAVYFFYQRRETMKKNRVLAREIAENLKRPSPIPSPGRPSPDPSLLREGSIYSQESATVGAGPVPARTSNTSPSSQEVTTPLPQQGGGGGGSEGSAGSAGSSDSALFEQLRDAILGEQLYLNAYLDRQMLVDRFGVPKERIGAAFAKGSPFKSLTDFLTDCRLPHAARLLTERPDLSIADVARASGFLNADTFGRNFKQKYTLTPTQYRESNGE